MPVFGKRSTGPQSPEQVRAELFAAIERGDQKAASAMVRRSMPVVLEWFRAWQTVPEPLRADPNAVQRWGGCLITIANLCAEHGQHAPRQWLVPPPELVDPVIGMMRDARARLTAQDYDGCAAVLAHVFAALDAGPSAKAEEARMFAEGWLGECHFQRGNAADAVEPLERALKLCERRRDRDGIVAQLGNLYEVHRYLDQPDPAGHYAEQLAARYEGMGRGPDARRMYRQAAIVRFGEPANRVVAVVNGEEYEVENAPLVDGTTQLVYTRSRITLAPAERLTTEASARGSAGDHEGALAGFEAAAAADPYDPNSRYLAGFALMHLQRHADAVASLELAEAIAPGWYHVRADLWLARAMLAGDVPHEVFLAIHALEDGDAPAATGIELARSVLGRFPDLAPLHLELGRRLVAVGDQGEAGRVFREGVERAVEPDIRSRLLVELARLTPDRQEQAELYDRARDPDGNLVAAALATMAVRRIRD